MNLQRFADVSLLHEFLYTRLYNFLGQISREEVGRTTQLLQPISEPEVPPLLAAAAPATQDDVSSAREIRIILDFVRGGCRRRRRPPPRYPSKTNNKFASSDGAAKGEIPNANTV